MTKNCPPTPHGSILAFDLETHKVQPGLLAPPIVCGSFYDGERGDLLRHPLERLRSALQSGITIAGANIAYDFACACAEDPTLLPLVFEAYEAGRIHDVQIAMALHFIANGWMQEGYLIDPRNGERLKSKGKITTRFSLETCVDLCLGRGDAKANDRWRTSYALLENTPLDAWPTDAKQYPIDDAKNTYEVAQAQLASCDNLYDLPAQCRAAFAEHLGSVWGIRVNGAALDERVRFFTDLHSNTAPFEKAGILVGGVEKQKVLQGLVDKAYGGKPPRTPKGGVSTARETLEDSGDPLLEAYAEHQKVERHLTTNLPFLRGGTLVPINVRPNVLLATGRSSYDGLIQLLPRKGGIRECIEPRPGHLWSACDYVGGELSSLGQVCIWTVGFSKLAEAINAGVDVHSLLGSQLVGLTYDEFLARKEEFKDIRQAAKAANFGFPGMMGAPKFVIAKRKEGLIICSLLGGRNHGLEKIWAWKGRQLDTPLCAECCREAEKLRSAYLSAWPEIPLYFNWVSATLAHRGDSLEQFVSKRVRGGLRAPQGANTLFQGLVADGAKRALWYITKECYAESGPLASSRVLIFAHDETIVEAPENRAHEAAHRQMALMIQGMKEFIPDVAVRVEPVLMTCWSKEAKPVYENERLIPWKKS